MSIDLPFYRNWVRERMRDGDQESALAVLDAYERLSEGGDSAADLALIREAARSRPRALWDIGTELLVDLARERPQAQGAIREILASTSARERFQITASLRSGLPRELLREAVLAGLTDRGCKVRLKAGEACERLDLRELLPELEAAAARETHQETRRSLERDAVMLRDGYSLEPFGGGEYSLTVRHPEGWVTRLISEKDVRRLPALIRELRNLPV